MASHPITPEEFRNQVTSILEQIDDSKFPAKPDALAGSQVTGNCDLRNLRCKSSLDLSNCSINGTLDLRNVRIAGSLQLRGLQCKTLLLNEAIIKGGLELDDVQLPLVNAEEESKGLVDLSGARVAGKLTAKSLRCRKLDADSLKVEGDFRFDYALILGQLNLLACSIQGSLRCYDPLEVTKDQFNKPPPTIVGQILARGATIRGELDLSELTVIGVKKEPVGILLDHATLGANVHCHGHPYNEYHNDFRCNGAFSAIGVKVQGNFQLFQGKILVDKNLYSLDLSNSEIGGELHLRYLELNQSVSFYGASVRGDAFIEALSIDGDFQGFSSTIGGRFLCRFWRRDERAKDRITTINGRLDLTGIEVKSDLELGNIWVSGLLRLDMASIGRLLCHSDFHRYDGSEKDALEYTIQTARFGEISISSARVSHDAVFSGARICGFSKSYRQINSNPDEGPESNKRPKGSLNFSRSTVGGALRFGMSNDRLEVENWLDALATNPDLHITSPDDLRDKLKPYCERYDVKDPFAASIAGNLILMGGEVKGRIDFSGLEVGDGAGEGLIKGVVDMRDRRIGRDILWGYSLLGKRSQVRRVDMSGITCGGELDMTGVTISGKESDEVVALDLVRAEIQDVATFVKAHPAEKKETQSAEIHGKCDFSAASFGKLVVSKKCLSDSPSKRPEKCIPKFKLFCALSFLADNNQESLKNRKNKCKQKSSLDISKKEVNPLYTSSIILRLFVAILCLLLLQIIVVFCLNNSAHLSTSLSNLWSSYGAPQSGFPPLHFPALTYLGSLIALFLILFRVLTKFLWKLPGSFKGVYFKPTEEGDQQPEENDQQPEEDDQRTGKEDRKRRIRRLSFRDFVQVIQSLFVPRSFWGVFCKTILLFLIVTPFAHAFVSYLLWLDVPMGRVGSFLPESRFSDLPEWPFLRLIFGLSLCIESALFLFQREQNEKSNKKPSDPRLDLTGVNVDHIVIYGGIQCIPKTLKLDGLNTRLWTVEGATGKDDDADEDFYVRILENTTPYQASNYAAFEAKSRNEGDYDSADEIRRAMKRQEQFRDERPARTFWLLLQSIIGYGTQRNKLIAFLFVWFVFTTTLFYAGWHEGQFALDPDLRAQADTGGPHTVEAYRDWLYLDNYTSLESLGASAALALRYHVPLIHVDALPEVIPVDFLRAYATVVSFAHWIILPLLLGSLLQSLIPKRE